MGEKATYTIAEIDDAIRALGNPRWSHGAGSMSRPHAMLDAASGAWISQREEDRHSARLRAALVDLNRTGFLHPHDGIWPEDDR